MKKAWSKLPLQNIWNSIRKNTYIEKIWHFARHFLTIPFYPRISVKPSLIWCEKHTFENKTFCRPNNANENERATQEKLSFQTSIQSVLFSTWLLEIKIQEGWNSIFTAKSPDLAQMFPSCPQMTAFLTALVARSWSSMYDCQLMLICWGGKPEKWVKTGCGRGCDGSRVC